MKKFFSLFAIILLLLALSIYWVIGNLDTLLKKQIESLGSQALNSPVTLDAVELDLSTGHGALRGLHIANPKGFQPESALGFEQAALQLDIQSLQSRPLVINEIRLDGLTALFEVNQDGESNLDVLLAHLKPAAKAPDTPEPAQEPAPSTGTQPTNLPGQAHRIRVNRLVISETAVVMDLSALGGKRVTQTLPALTIENIGGESGVPPQKLSEALGRILLHHIARGATRYAMDFVDPTRLKHADEYSDTLEKLNRTLKSAGKELKEGTEAVGEKLKGQMKAWGLDGD